MLQIDILTLFPDSMAAVLGESIIGNGIKKGYLSIDFHQIRDYTLSKQARVDDAPYGGGMGMLMQADPLYRAHKAVCKMRGKEHIHTIYLSAQGQVYNQKTARRLATLDNFILVCGHYEGIDQRFIDECVDEEISLGDFVLTGGEIPALAVADSVGRLLPGVLADESCFTDESHWSGLLEYPHFTRPEVWNGRAVPEVLLSGNHEKIRKWRRREALLATRAKRPDLWAKFTPTKEDVKLLEEE
ncbi:MAG TPA: tRNA (guanosine(37)-N1)-methyltransferase TrmD [Clostridiales bacterium]|jgi:tRNA (guanine37-N1)-methyltransferase|nr:tRNA (guanosine(37)-N1)-methyltransferase TrmD [Clostridiales bacterium]